MVKLKKIIAVLFFIALASIMPIAAYHDPNSIEGFFAALEIMILIGYLFIWIGNKMIDWLHG